MPAKTKQKRNEKKEKWEQRNKIHFNWYLGQFVCVMKEKDAEELTVIYDTIYKPLKIVSIQLNSGKNRLLKMATVEPQEIFFRQKL